MSDKTHNTTIKMLENVIILEVDNILQGWPAYVITFTPEDTHPHKIILHLKNPSKYVTVESDDEDDDTGARVSEHKKLITNSDGRVMVTVQDNDGPSLQYESEETSDDGDDETSQDGDDETSQDGEDKTSVGDKTLSTTVHAIPVALAGIPKDTVRVKRKAFDPAWPPRRPRAFRSISPRSSIASYEGFMTWPEAVKSVESSGGPDLE
ncbi:hypothetical protein PISMIDRAFT_13772 [Pisolithus microcarpus 441]|uniref:Uncharacterized protein n=1 Tax=Pisolithus microcarpus 441 TaxID=765257 RepID=A0A0C9YRH0_9AGAM|nr:hypothetical protein PISMIDRAFT_13772 [Pisolithus microcarpus 441]